MQPVNGVAVTTVLAVIGSNCAVETPCFGAFFDCNDISILSRTLNYNGECCHLYIGMPRTLNYKESAAICTLECSRKFIVCLPAKLQTRDVWRVSWDIIPHTIC